jgi:hypothetical protein
MVQLVVTMDVEPSQGPIWTLIRYDVFLHQEIVALSTRALEIENFQLQRAIEDLVESLKKVISKTNGSVHSSTMNFCEEHDSH